jgi:ParB/RepB/Spo0J family partition protein
MMQINQIPHEDIEIDKIDEGERYRKDYGDLNKLASSIKRQGLIHPPAVMPQDGGRYLLLAGGRRFAAIKELRKRDGVKTITCRIFPKDTDDLQVRVIERAENIFRKDLTWHEDLALKNEIHKLQQQIHGKKTSTSPDAPGWSQQDTANMIGKSAQSISGDLKLANMMEQLPDIEWSKFKNKSEAAKAVAKVENEIKREQKAAAVESSFKGEDDFKKKLIDSYNVMDFFEGVKSIGDATIDLCEIDPPYAIDLENVKKGYDYDNYNEIKAEDYPNFIKRVVAEAYRVMKKDSWMIFWFASEPWFEMIYQTIVKAGFKCSRQVGVWVKGEEDEESGEVRARQGQATNPDYTLANAFEMFFLARKGAPKIVRRGHTNVFPHKPVPAVKKIHPTERPVALIEDLLTTLSDPGSRIMVPFAGSGNTLIAAARSRMFGVGFDLEKKSKEGFMINVFSNL